MFKPRILNKLRINPDKLAITHVETSLSIEHISNLLHVIWNEIQRKSLISGKKLWDGLYYRIENLNDIQLGRKELLLSTIKYSIVRSLMEYNKTVSFDAVMAPLNVNTGGLIKTSDDVFIFGKKKTIANSYIVDLVGGGLQKNELLVNFGNDLKLNIFKEINEEINISKNYIVSSEIIGYILSEMMSIIIIFEINLNLKFNEVINAFKLRNDFELFDVIGIPDNDLSNFLSSQKRYISLINGLI